MSSVLDRCVEENEAIIVNEDMAHIFVGSAPTVKFTVHELTLRSRPGLCRTHLATARCIHWPNAEPETFRRYLNLIYAGQLVTKGTKEWENLSVLYVFAQELEDAVAQNSIIDAMHVKLCEVVSSPSEALKAKNLYPTDALSVLYANSSESCPARRLLIDFYIDFYIDCVDESWLRNEVWGLPREFLCDVVGRFVQQRTASSQFHQSASCYHEKVPLSSDEVKAGVPLSTPQQDKSSDSESAMLTAQTVNMEAATSEREPMNWPWIFDPGLSYSPFVTENWSSFSPRTNASPAPTDEEEEVKGMDVPC